MKWKEEEKGFSCRRSKEGLESKGKRKGKNKNFDLKTKNKTKKVHSPSPVMGLKPE